MKRKKIKVAIYSGAIPSTTFIERLIEELAKADLKIVLFGLVKGRYNYPASVSNKGYRNFRIYKGLYLLFYALLLSLFRNRDKKKLDEILAKRSRNLRRAKLNAYPVLWYQPDIFHIQWAKSLDDWMWVEAFGMKIVLSLRGAHINYSPIADLDLADSYCRNFPKINGFHAVCHDIANEATKYEANSQKIKVVYSGLQLNLPTSPNKKSSRSYNMISVGRLHWKKGYHYALDACKILKDHDLNFCYTLIGVDPSVELLYQVHELGLSENIRFLGSMPNNEVLEQIKSADLLLLPSVEEGIANVVIEAMALNTLVLSTNCGGMPELVDDEINGYLVPIRDPKLMAEKIVKISSLTEEKISQIKQNALDKVASQHNVEKMRTEMLQLYNQVLEN